MTPQPVYDTVLDYVKKHYDLSGKQIERPFWPGGDYQAAAKQYDELTVVVDNPPFSKLSKILKFYIDNNIKFFIFAPALTILESIKAYRKDAQVVIGSTITYENGAKVATNFVTNLKAEPLIVADRDLVKALQQLNKKQKAQVKNIYPPRLLSSAELFRKAQHGVSFKISNDAVILRKVDACLDGENKPYKIFGNALVVSELKSAELKAAELNSGNVKYRRLKLPEQFTNKDNK